MYIDSKLLRVAYINLSVVHRYNRRRRSISRSPDGQRRRLRESQSPSHRSPSPRKWQPISQDLKSRLGPQRSPPVIGGGRTSPAQSLSASPSTSPSGQRGLVSYADWSLIQSFVVVAIWWYSSPLAVVALQDFVNQIQRLVFISE